MVIGELDYSDRFFSLPVNSAGPETEATSWDSTSFSFRGHCFDEISGKGAVVSQSIQDASIRILLVDSAGTRSFYQVNTATGFDTRACAFGNKGLYLAGRDNDNLAVAWLDTANLDLQIHASNVPGILKSASSRTSTVDASFLGYADANQSGVLLHFTKEQILTMDCFFLRYTTGPWVEFSLVFADAGRSLIYAELSGSGQGLMLLTNKFQGKYFEMTQRELAFDFGRQLSALPITPTTISHAVSMVDVSFEESWTGNGLLIPASAK